MPLAGGPSDKAGNSYERRWTVLALTELLLGNGQALRIEVPGEAGEGAEFRLLVEGVPEWHQAKRQREAGPWTIHNLSQAGILGSWWPKIQAGGRCVFVSSTGAQELRELVERAASAASWAEFKAEFLTGDQQQRFQRLRRAWDDPPEEAVFRALRRVDVRLIDEAQLARWVQDRLRALVGGVPGTAAAVLGQFVDDTVHRELAAKDVWERLASHGIAPRNLSQDHKVVLRLGERVESYLQGLRALYIDGRELRREEADQTFSHLLDGRRVLLAGGAGAGKSAIVAQVVQRARRKGWPVLVLAADRFPSADTVHRLGAELGLPDSPATVLGGRAAGGNALLVVDQLDAVSVVSGRHPERLGLVSELLTQAASYPRLYVVLACRRFDLDNDRELRAVAGAAESVAVSVGELDASVLDQVLSDAGIPTDLPSNLRRLLTVPLHLAIFVEVARAGANGLSGVRTLTDLYNRYWEVKRQACRAARDGQDEWLAVVDRLTDYMSDQQELAVPLPVLDDLDRQVKVMASFGVLVADQKGVAFFHETFFDYCFARRFIGTGGRLRNLLASGEQDLFRRGQVRQLLVYERASDALRPSYLQDLAWLLSAEDVRLHLKVLVLALLETIPDPTVEEWAIVRSLADDASSPLHLRCWQAFRDNPAWFPVIQAAGGWQSWLESTDPAIIDRALWALAGMTGAAPQQVVDLVRRLPRDAAWARRARGFLWMASVHGNHVPCELLQEAISEGLYDTGASQDLWHALHRLATTEPARAVDLLRLLLGRAMRQARAAGEPNPFKLTGPLAVHQERHASEAVAAAARSAAAEFVDRLLLPLLAVMRRNAVPERDRSDALHDLVWSGHIVDNEPHLREVHDELYAGMEAALRRLTTSDPDLATAAFATLRAAPYESAWFLLARAYCANPAQFADQAVAWLASTPAALRLGYMDAPHWVSRELVAAISPACGAEQLDQLVEALLYYAPPFERSYSGLKARGRGELCLLNAVDPARRLPRVQRRLAELRRKFGVDDVSPPRGIQFDVVPPPISNEAAAKMTDRQWLRAIARYQSSELQQRPDGRLVGDATTQAQVLAEATKVDPQRFVRLLLRFPGGTAAPYVAAVLRGLAGARVDPELLLRACQHAQQLAGRDANHEIVWLVEAEAAASLPAALVRMVAQIAASDPDPTSDDWMPRQPAAEPRRGEALDLAGLNCTRGAAAAAIGKLLFEDPSRLGLVRDALSGLAIHPTVQVRAMAALALTSLLEIDPELAVALFRSTVTNAPDDLLASRYLERFLHYTIRAGHYPAVADILSRMIACPVEEAQQAGARQLTVASFAAPELDPLVNAALKGDEATRVGVLGVFAANVTDHRRRDRAVQALKQGFADPSPKARSSAVRAFQALGTQHVSDPRCSWKPLPTAPRFRTMPASSCTCLRRAASRSRAWPSTSASGSFICTAPLSETSPPRPPPRPCMSSTSCSGFTPNMTIPASAGDAWTLSTSS
jgi:hypothetical protein